MKVPEIFKGKKLAKEFKPHIEEFKKIPEEDRKKILKQKIKEFNEQQKKIFIATIRVLKKSPKLDKQQKKEFDMYLKAAGYKNEKK